VDGATGRDTNDCSAQATPCRTIQAAINQSSDGDSILVAAGTYSETLTITRSLAITGGVNLSGTESGPTVVDAAGLMNSVATISTTAGVTLTTMTLQHGNKQGGDGTGGGIDALAGSVTLSDTTVLSNTASGDGGGISMIGAAPLSVISSTLSDNQAGPGAAAANVGSTGLNGGKGSDGGGIYMNGATAPLSVISSTLSGNQAGYAGGVSFGHGGAAGGSGSGSGGGIYAGGAVTLTTSPVLGNSASGDGGGIEALSAVTVFTSTLRGNRAGGQGGALAAGSAVGAAAARVRTSTFFANAANLGGGAIAIFSSALALTNTTLIGNAANLGGGGAITTSGALSITASTLVSNTADLAGGAIATTMGAAATLTNALLAFNRDGGGGAPNSCAAPVADGGHNLEYPSNTCGFSTGAPYNDQFGDPLVASMLADNGGPTPTLAVAAAGAAYAHGDGTVCRQPVPDGVGGVDQRGYPRPTTGPCTIGAFEPQSTTLTLASAPNPSVVGQQVTLTTTVAPPHTQASPVTGRSPSPPRTQTAP